MQTETDRLIAARTAPTLADLMLARGAVLVGPAPRTIEQAVSAAEVITEAEAITEQAAEDVPVVEVGEVPADAPCSHPSCAHADPASPCRCSFCIGAGHGWIVAQAQDAARTRTQARIDAAGGIFAALRTAGALADDDEAW